MAIKEQKINFTVSAYEKKIYDDTNGTLTFASLGVPPLTVPLGGGGGDVTPQAIIDNTADTSSVTRTIGTSGKVEFTTTTIPGVSPNDLAITSITLNTAIDSLTNLTNANISMLTGQLETGCLIRDPNETVGYINHIFGDDVIVSTLFSKGSADFGNVLMSEYNQETGEWLAITLGDTTSSIYAYAAENETGTNLNALSTSMYINALNITMYSIYNASSYGNTVVCGLFNQTQGTSVNLGQMLPNSGVIALKDRTVSKMNLLPVASTGETFPMTDFAHDDQFVSIDFSNFNISELGHDSYSAINIKNSSSDNIGDIQIFGNNTLNDATARIFFAD
jgi:hypothetical protein